MNPTGLSGESTTPRAPARRTIFRLLLVQSLATAVLLLGVLVATAGIDQRLLILLGVLAALGVSAGLSRWHSRKWTESLEHSGPTSKESTDKPAQVAVASPAAAAKVASGSTGSPLKDGLDALLETLPWAIWITDPDGRVLHHNAMAGELIETASTKLKGQTVEAWWTKWATPSTWPELHRTVKSGKTWHTDLELVTPEDSTSLEVTAVPLQSAPGAQTILFLAEDVTELRQLGLVLIDLERLSTRGQMAGDVAHEINNFLTILGGNLDIIPMLLASGNHDKVQAKFVAMRGVLDRIACFTDGLMVHREEAEPGPCDLNKQIENLLAFLKPQNRFDGVEWVYQPNPDLPKANVRAPQIQQVLVNLLNNAADAIHQGSRKEGKIVVTARALPGRPEVALTVKDDGPGLSKDASARIFRERFTDKPKGHGLGLMNCHAIVRSLGGTLTAESAQGHGAAFTLTLPCLPDTEPRTQPAPVLSSA